MSRWEQILRDEGMPPEPRALACRERWHGAGRQRSVERALVRASSVGMADQGRDGVWRQPALPGGRHPPYCEAMADYARGCNWGAFRPVERRIVEAVANGKTVRDIARTEALSKGAVDFVIMKHRRLGGIRGPQPRKWDGTTDGYFAARQRWAAKSKAPLTPIVQRARTA